MSADDPFFTPEELRIVNSCASRAFAEWCEAGDSSNYIDLARRLNLGCLRAHQALKAKRNKVARCVP